MDHDGRDDREGQKDNEVDDGSQYLNEDGDAGLSDDQLEEQNIGNPEPSIDVDASVGPSTKSSDVNI